MATPPQKTLPVAEQTTFTEDGPVQHTISLPPEVLELLLKTEAGKQGMDFAGDSLEEHPAQMFRAAQVSLKDRNEVDAVVIGVCPMCGADQGWFWVVRSVYKNPKVVLFTGGNSLALLRSETNGYPNIRSILSLASQTRNSVYRFDGQQYKLWKEKWTENPN